MPTLVIGNGDRVFDTIIPALNASEEKIYLHGRNKEKVSLLCKEHQLLHQKDLRTLPNDLNKIFICLPTDVILNYLKILKNFDTLNIDLFIDTPIFGSFSNVNILRYGRYFKSHNTTEDWLSKIFFLTALELQKKYNLGNLLKIQFLHSGFSYHSLAVSRFLLIKKPLKRVFKKINSDGNYSHIYKFSGAEMEILGPKNYDDCKTILTYQNGRIIDNFNSETIEPDKSLKETIIFYRHLDANNIYGYFYDFPSKKIFKSNVTTKSELPIPIINHYENQEKIASLISKISFNEQQYDLIDGSYDSLVQALFNKFNYFYDFHFFNTSILKLGLKLYGKL